MDAIDFLLKEHDKVRKKFAEIKKKKDPKSFLEEFDALCKDLLVHEKMEQIVWYPKIKENKKLYETIKHLISEEQHAEKAIKGFKSSPDEEKWEKFLKINKDVDHHADEEETKLFPQVKKMMSKEELLEIGHEMYLFKKNK